MARGPDRGRVGWWGEGGRSQRGGGMPGRVRGEIHGPDPGYLS